VDDADKAVAELRKKGVKCDDVVTIPGMVSFANVYDPEGNRLQLAKSLAE
jgi:predicted enzyme related to lactoylglutathione lyase